MSNVSAKAVLSADDAVEPATDWVRSIAPRGAHDPKHCHAYFDTPRAAQRLGVSPRTLVDYRSRGGGPKWVRIARAVRYRADWLDQWADDKAVTSTSQETAQARR